jgi:magnesium-transporting ATPase (P-type)
MMLADDNFATIVRAVREGRNIFDNIQKFLRYLLSSNMGEVLTIFLGIVLAGVIGLDIAGDGLVPPLLATQILWINLITDSGPALAMGVDPDTDGVMTRRPREPSEPIIDAAMWRGVIVVGLMMAIATLATIDLYLPGGLMEGGRSLDEARTAGFTVLVFAQLFNCLNARSTDRTAFRNLFANRWLWGAIGLSVVLQVAVVQLPILNSAFGTVPLEPSQWLFCVLMSCTILCFGELGKLLRRRRH